MKRVGLALLLVMLLTVPATAQIVSYAAPLPVPAGGTGTITLTLNGVLYGNGGAAVQAVAACATGTVLIGGASAPSCSATPTLTSLTAPTLIGGTGPTSTLTLKSTTGIGTSGADVIFQVGNNGATEAMRIVNSGNVGIGTSNPGVYTVQSALDVHQATGTSLLAISTSGAGQVARLVVNANGKNWLVDNRGSSETPNNRLSIFGDNGAGGYFEAVSILPTSGNVGIGTSNPSTFLLQVAGGIGPNADNATDLGSAVLRIRSGYFGTSLAIGAAPGIALTGGLFSAGVTFASLGTPSNGMIVFCTDCAPATLVDQTCAGAGTGALAVRQNGAWKCIS